MLDNILAVCITSSVFQSWDFEDGEGPPEETSSPPGGSQGKQRRVDGTYIWQLTGHIEGK